MVSTNTDETYMNNQETGKMGEKIAVKYLRKKGYRILDRNFEFRVAGRKKGELDIVVKKRGVVSFVEVKTLDNREETFAPEDKIDFKKKKSIIKTAEFWLLKNKIPLQSKYQIDIVSVKLDFQTRKAKVSHFFDAFGE